MAEIHLARTTGIGGFEKLLALKVIHPKFSADQEFIDMLVDEAKIAVQLSHVNVGQIFDLGQVDGVYYIAMEFIDGRDLYQLLVRCSELGIEIPFDIIAFIAKEVAAGLHYAHTRSDNYGRPLNIIHRDVSPQNVLVSYDGQVKIVDFGIAKASQRSRETEGGIIKGKFFYMSPEQAWGDTLDGRSDIFSAGICLYEMITGEMLYNEDKALLLLEKVRKAEIPSMRRRRPDIPPLLEQVTLKALARDVGDRYQSGEELQGALSGYLYGNWPSFNRRRVADFMKQVFGDQRFVLPMPPAPEEVVPVEDAQNRSFMDAEDFEHITGQSVIFDLADLEGEEIIDEDEAPTVAAAFAEEDIQAAFMAQMGEDDGDTESTLGAAWDATGLDDDDQDRTAILDAGRLNFDQLPPIGVPAPVLDPPTPAAVAVGPGIPLSVGAPESAAPQTEERTRVFSKQDISNQDLVGLPPEGGETLKPDTSSERAAPNPVMPQAGPNPTPIAVTPDPRAGLREQAPSPQPIMDKTSAVPASLLAKAMPQSMGEVPAQSTPHAEGLPTATKPVEAGVPIRQTPRIPEVEPAGANAEQIKRNSPAQVRPKPRNSAPNLAPKKPVKSAKAGGGRNKLKATSARKKKKGGLASTLLSGKAITILILSILLVYGAIAFLPTLFAEPPPQEAVLIIKSVPADAKVIHNGQDTGLITEAKLTGLTVGTEHKVRLELPGYDAYEETIKIPVEGNADGIREVPKTFFLAKAKGTLKITSDPPDAEVYMDGRYLGNTPMDKGGVSREKRESKLTIRLTGYYEKTLSITWGSKVAITRSVKLKKRSR